MQIFILTAISDYEEVSGTKHFTHRRAFVNKATAEAFSPLWVEEILNDNKTGILTYCNVRTKILTLELCQN